MGAPSRPRDQFPHCRPHAFHRAARTSRADGLDVRHVSWFALLQWHGRGFGWSGTDFAWTDPNSDGTDTARGPSLVFVILGAAVWHFSRGEFPNIVINLVLASLAAFVAYGRWRLSLLPAHEGVPQYQM